MLNGYKMNYQRSQKTKSVPKSESKIVKKPSLLASKDTKKRQPTIRKSSVGRNIKRLVCVLKPKQDTKRSSVIPRAAGKKKAQRPKTKKSIHISILSNKTESLSSEELIKSYSFLEPVQDSSAFMSKLRIDTKLSNLSSRHSFASTPHRDAETSWAFIDVQKQGVPNELEISANVSTNLSRSFKNLNFLQQIWSNRSSSSLSDSL